jgi:hypothetical protein
MRGALLVGIENYVGPARLSGPVNDATELANLLDVNEDGSQNFSVILKNNVSTRSELRSMIITFFSKDHLNTALFYFSGHGAFNERGGFIVTPDFKQYDEGISMDEILNIVNQSKIKDKVVIIDCCHAGALGNPVIVGSSSSYLAEGVTILTSARQSELAMELDGHGIFTALLLSALQGGAADLEGNITPGSVYTYIDRSLSFWQQRPQFKTNVNRFTVLRTISPRISIGTVLKKITTYFPDPVKHFPLDPSYEYTNVSVANPENVATFKNLQKMQSVGLVVPVDEEYMYWAAQNSKACKLTLLGMHYWRLVKENKI